MSAETLKAIAVVAELSPHDGHPLSTIAESIRNAPPAAWQSTNTPKRKKSMIALAANATTTATPGARLRLRQLELVKTVGARLKASRELNNLSLSEAAARLGYSNPSKLSKVENATDTNSVPLWLIRDAARIYDVSTEYLFGLNDDWECGVHRGLTPYLLDQWEQMRRRDLQALVGLQQHIEAATSVIPAIQRDAQEILDAIDRLAGMNGDAFLDMRGGSILTAAAERLKKTAREAATAQKRLNLVPAKTTPAADNEPQGGRQ